MISIVIASFVEKEINPRKYMRIHTPTVVKGGVGGGQLDGTPPQSILYVAVFRNDFAFGESLSSSRQDEVHFMGGGAAGGLWRHQKMVAILDFTKNYKLG